MSGDLRNLGDTLAQVRGRVANSKPAYRAISDLMVSSAQQNFETEGRPEKWVALKPATQKFKEKHGWTKILFRSGRLRASITGQGGTTGDSATIGSVLPYAQGQNDGATIIHPNRPGKTLHRYSKKTGQLLGFAKKNAKDGKRIGVIEMAFAGHAMNTAITLPARPYLVIQSEDVEQYTGILNRYWFEGVL